MCGGGECILEGSVLPCTEQGIRNAIAAGGGPYTFACDGPTTVVTEATIDIDNDVILDGEGSLTVDGDEDHGVFLVFRDVAAELRGFTVTKGNGCCERGEGGGISNGGTLTLTHSTVSGNFSDVGGISNGGTLTLTHSTVSGNRGGYGGGIFNYGTLTLTNSTLSGNTAVFGGAIFIGGGTGGTATLTNCTVSGNSAEDGGAFWGGTVTLTNTLVDGECGGATSGGGNLESPRDTCGFDQPTDQVNISAEDLKLGPLADNGGPTMTHALGTGSVAIDQIPEGDCVDADGQPLTTDQRGEPRPETGGTLCDVGAFEVQP
jgi:hypothetical protein